MALRFVFFSDPKTNSESAELKSTKKSKASPHSALLAATARVACQLKLMAERTDRTALGQSKYGLISPDPKINYFLPVSFFS